MNLETEFTTAKFVILKVVKKWKKMKVLVKEEKIFWPRQNFANAN